MNQGEAFTIVSEAWYQHCVTCRACNAWSAGNHTILQMLPHLCAWGRKNNHQYLELTRPETAEGTFPRP